MLKPFLLALPLLFGLSLSAHADDAAQSFGHWRVSCRHDGYCAATAPPGPESTTVGILHIGRPAEESYWELGIAAIGAVADPASNFLVNVDGRSLSFAPPAEIAPFGAVADYYFQGRNAQALIDALVHGASASVGFTALDGRPEKSSFFLGGLGAALIAIDTRQHRIGSERVAGPAPVGLLPIHLEAAHAAGGSEPQAGAPVSEAGLLDPPVLLPGPLETAAP